MLLSLTSSGVDSIVQLITVVIIFLFVLVLTYSATRFTAELQKGKMSRANIDVIETLKIAPTKYIQIVKIGEKYFSYVICKDTVTLLGELSEDDVSELEKTQTSSLFDVSFKVFYRFRSAFGEKANINITHIGMKNGNLFAIFGHFGLESVFLVGISVIELVLTHYRVACTCCA